MVDTVGIKSPYITEEIAQKIEQECTKRIGINIKTNDIIYEVTTGHLLGSYDSRIQIKVDRYEYKSIKLDKISSLANGYDKIPILTKCEPYIYIECSIHKLMLGHNCFGGTDNYNLAIKYLINFIENIFNIKLPYYEEWQVKRIDYAKVFDLGSPLSVQEYLRGLNNANYPRRQVYKYGLTGLYAPGVTTAVKFYHKGIEFKKHDKNRLKHQMDFCDIIDLENKAMNLLRVEVEIKQRKLKNDFEKEVVYVKDITTEYLNKIYNIEVNKIIKEGNENMKILRDVRDVKNRLIIQYGNSLGNTILNTWFQLTTLGEELVKKTMSKSTYYRHIQYLKYCNISWLNTDVTIIDNKIVPNDFLPLTDDIRCINEVHNSILNKLKVVA